MLPVELKMFRPDYSFIRVPYIPVIWIYRYYNIGCTLTVYVPLINNDLVQEGEAREREERAQVEKRSDEKRRERERWESGEKRRIDRRQREIWERATRRRASESRNTRYLWLFTISYISLSPRSLSLSLSLSLSCSLARSLPPFQPCT